MALLQRGGDYLPELHVFLRKLAAPFGVQRIGAGGECLGQLELREELRKRRGVLLRRVRCGAAAFKLKKRLRQTAGLDGELLACLLKIVGIGLIGEVASAVCADAGNGALGKTVQMLSAAAALWLAVPLFETLLTLLGTVLGEA